MVFLPADILFEYAHRLLLVAGVPCEHAELLARSFVAASLRGVDSHGVQLLPYYLDRLEAGDIDPVARGQVSSENGTCLVYDGGNGLGQVVADVCTTHANRLAQAHGVGLVVARHSNHFGACAFWAQRLSAAGNVGIVLSNTPPFAPPWQGKEVRLGTNPICMSVPGTKTWLLDMATTTVAGWKIRHAANSRQSSIPEGWAMNAEGIPTTDTTEAMKGLLMPLGGYKGSGLAMMVEILCGVLGGGSVSLELGGYPAHERTASISHCFLAIDVTRFMPMDAFNNAVEKLVRFMKETPPAVGYGEVLVAGEPEWREEANRSVNGIPMSDRTWNELLESGKRFNVAPPDAPVD
jgi:LDH2 family malate/lactate/ureidoglycolate dehydrogenase